MDNASLKFAIVGALAIGLLFFVPGAFEGFESQVVPENAASFKGTTKARKNGALLKASLGRQAPKSAAVNLLPKPCADAGFAQFAPDPKVLQGQNFVDASRWVELGAMTSKRNINRDLRAEIPIPKNNAISPFLQSTIDQQVAHRPLDC